MVAAFVLRRLGAGILLLLTLSFLVFCLLALSPGTPLQALLGTRPASPELVDSLNARYHLNDPFLVQYGRWLAGVCALDFGQSISVQSDAPVGQILSERMALTLQLGGYALVLILLVGIPLGMLAGIRRGRRTDRAISAGATVAISAPAFVLAIVLLYVFGVALKWFPVYGTGTGFAERVSHLTLPAVALATVLSGILVRQTRAAMLTAMSQDYITFARLRGLSPGRVLVRYALRNAALPVVTSLGLILVAALTSTLFIEQVFSLPGIGTLLLAAVTNNDVPVVQGAVLVLGASVILTNLAVDLLGLALDPRTRFAVKDGA
ncbi:ABC transporter permease [Streptomyces spongiae]|uniref:ABC transporter permease n=1 Tax=Streptomyces spongiae TaxID=565072 RepID=A0A5N8X978_9ACTN|nr:ABC transporter permease [Streptomyces spongiae]MPY55654.1 ABC transporter permease [Streptomyces spongiae]